MQTSGPSAARQPLPEVNMKFKRATLERAEKFISDIYFTDVNLRGQLYPDTQPVEEIHHYGNSGRYLSPAQATGGRGEVKVGDSFGPTWATHWFRVTAEVPERFAGQQVRLRWNTGCEAMVYSTENEPLQGLTELGGQERTDFILSRSAVTGQRYVFHIEMACNPIMGAGHAGMINPPDPNRTFTLAQCELAVYDPDCAALYYDLELLVAMASKMDDKWPRSYQALYTANEIVNACRVGDRDSYKRCHEIARQFFNQHNGDSQLTIASMANCHIDCAWLWTYEETVRKCARSFASTLRLMEDYPELNFACSQAQQYEWVKVHYPGLYDRMKTAVADGRFIPVGGSWVEMDANMPGSEALARQFLVGQRFFKQEFGQYCQVFWLPDTFGYSSQLPQLMTSAGMKYFLTQKISWNLINKFPHHSFKWQGLDGTQVITHFPPANTYGCEVTIDEVLKTVTNLEDKGRVSESLMLYGYGDGGGGPTEGMLERMQRLKDCDGLPRIRPSTPMDFFSKLESTSASSLCTWVGEMYLELHNATYTTQAEIKKANRVGEFLLRDAETVSAFASLLKLADYPHTELLRIWKLFLLNQFHDILPGTSIEAAHDLAKDYYKDVHKSAKQMFLTGLDALLTSPTGQPSTEAAATGTDSSSVLTPALVNPFSWQREEVCRVPAGVQVPDGCSVQRNAGDDGSVLALVQVPSLGVACGKTIFSASQASTAVVEAVEESVGAYRLSNKHLHVTIDRHGQLTSLIVNKTGREALPEGQTGNRLVMFDDIPLFWDAWDVMPYHLETRRVLDNATELSVTETGPLRVSVQYKVQISERSHLVQTISLCSNEEFVRFHTRVDWHENRQFLKVEFPVDVSSTEATYETQFGHTRRPTHSNTSWDVAKFELCGHKWCDYSEYGFGMAVMTDCKYGYCAKDKLIRISLLRSPKAPDGNSDMGCHEFSYAVFPHQGSFQDAGVIRQSYNFNHPLSIMARASSSPQAAVPASSSVSWLTIDNPAIVLEAVKMAEEQVEGRPGSLILRLYESFGGRATGNIRLTFPGALNVQSVVKCNILEEAIADSNGDTPSLTSSGSQTAQLCVKPFEVVTLRLEF
eukprot:scpid24513/ scgid1061/ Alpha-mannosidase 2C1; Alpha mannosidase 6A8B; Alpha-D-mannoside mannohydrolase; Mannosidase alpha class 2C member 1